LDAKIIHLGGTGLMDKMDGEPSFALMEEAKRRGRTTTLDVFASTRDDMRLVEGLLPHTDYFMPSIEEARALSGLESIGEVAQFLLDLGVKCCVLTLGENGVYYCHRDGTRFHVPAFEIEVVCTCGCGDAFNAGFATALNRGLDPESAVRFAEATSALNATGLGSQAGVTSFEHTMDFAQKTPQKSNRIAV
ncbi:MAG: carbohydrate kinase family protein, partial [Alphaproteobacteria bacterium]